MPRWAPGPGSAACSQRKSSCRRNLQGRRTHRNPRIEVAAPRSLPQTSAVCGVRITSWIMARRRGRAASAPFTRILTAGAAPPDDRRPRRGDPPEAGDVRAVVHGALPRDDGDPLGAVGGAPGRLLCEPDAPELVPWPWRRGDLRGEEMEALRLV